GPDVAQEGGFVERDPTRRAEHLLPAQLEREGRAGGDPGAQVGRDPAVDLPERLLDVKQLGEGAATQLDVEAAPGGPRQVPGVVDQREPTAGLTETVGPEWPVDGDEPTGIRIRVEIGEGVADRR